MKRSGTKTTTVGEIVNLMSVDCQRIQDAFLFSFYVVLIFVIVAIATVQLWDLMGKFWYPALHEYLNAAATAKPVLKGPPLRKLVLKGQSLRKSGLKGQSLRKSVLKGQSLRKSVLKVSLLGNQSERVSLLGNWS